jgi:hypothetical protein
MKRFKLPPRDVPSDIYTLLFTSWVQLFGQQRLSLGQHGSGPTAQGGYSYNFGVTTEKGFILDRSPDGWWTLKSFQGLAESELEGIVTDAIAHASAGDFGEGAVYETTMQAKGFGMDSITMFNFPRLLGDQMHIDGARRLGNVVLLDFLPKSPLVPAAPQLFAPETDIKVTILAPGPVAGDFAHKIAAGVAETVAAICAFALGRPVVMPLMIFPETGHDLVTAQGRRFDASILGLARDHVSLDVFGEFATLAGLDGVLRVRGSLLSYHAALQQASPDVAMMLMVSSLEALIVPRPEWRKEKATKRFIMALDVLCPDVIDTTVKHSNVEQAFGYKRKGGAKARRRQLLDQIYAQRSNPTHSGIGLSGVGMLSAFMDSGSMRVALLSDLARGALLKFLQAPQSSLIGHPMFEPNAKTGDDSTSSAPF